MNLDNGKGRPIGTMWSQRNPSLRNSRVGKVFLKNLHKSIDSKPVYDTFSAFGNILSCRVPTDDEGRSKGFGFVDFETEEAANNAILKVNGMLLKGRKMFVEKCIPREERKVVLRDPSLRNSRVGKIFIRNFGKSIDNEALYDTFLPFGNILSCRIATDDEGNSKGFGFVDFETEEAANIAIINVNGMVLNGRKIFVGKFVPRKEREAALANSAQYLLSSLRTGTFARNPNACEEINDFAEKVKTRLDEVTEMLDIRRDLQHETAAHLVETLEEKLRCAMDERRLAGVVGIIGDITQAIGDIFFENKYGKAAFWSGQFVSVLSDFIAEDRRGKVQNFVSQINRIFKADEDSFHHLSVEIQRLDDTIKAKTGWSLYSEEFKKFLSVAAERPERISNLPECANIGAEHEINLLTLGRNRKAIRTLVHIMATLNRDDTSYVSIIYHLLASISVVQRGTSRDVALQFGKVALKGAQLFREYKQDQATLAEVFQGVGRMRQEFQAIQLVCPDREYEHFMIE